MKFIGPSMQSNSDTELLRFSENSVQNKVITDNLFVTNSVLFPKIVITGLASDIGSKVICTNGTNQYEATIEQDGYAVIFVYDAGTYTCYINHNGKVYLLGVYLANTLGIVEIDVYKNIVDSINKNNIYNNNILIICDSNNDYDAICNKDSLNIPISKQSNVFDYKYIIGVFNIHQNNTFELLKFHKIINGQIIN